MKFAFPEDVIIHKIFAGRDLEDIKSILLKVSNLDIKYIERWLKEFDESFSEMSILKRFKDILKEVE